MKVLFYILYINSIYTLSIKGYAKLYKYVKHNVLDTSDCQEKPNSIQHDYSIEDNYKENHNEEEHTKDVIENVTEDISQGITEDITEQINNSHHNDKSHSQSHSQNDNNKNNNGHSQTDNNKNNNSQTSIATFYFRVGPDVEGCPAVQTFNDGNSYGPCNSEDGSQGVKYTSNSKYWAAIANAASRCGQMITANYNGRSIQLKVMDECPACQTDNHVDMSLDALIELTGSKELACSINNPLPMITWH